MASSPAQRTEGDTRAAPLQRGLCRGHLCWHLLVEDDGLHLVRPRHQPSQAAGQAWRGPKQVAPRRQGLEHRRDQGAAEGGRAGRTGEAGLLPEGYPGLRSRDDHLHLVLCSHRLHNDQRRLIFTVLYCCFSVGWYCTLILLGKSCPKRNVAWFYQCLNSYMFCRCTKLMLAILVTLWCPECLWSPAKVNFISTDVQGFIACKSIVEHLTFYNEAVQEFQFSGSLQLQSLRWHKTCDWLTRKKNQPRGKYIWQNGPLE